MNKDNNGFFPIKILFLGASNVGKTSLIKRLINREDYKIDILHDFTIGLDIYLKGFQTEGQLIKCELWDTPGILGSIMDNMLYIKYVHVIIFVFDLSSKDSFSEIKIYYNRYKNFAKQLKLNSDVIIIGNKLDKINNREVSFEEINDFSMKNNITFYEMSAKDNKTGYTKLFKCIENIAKNILIKYKILEKSNYFNIIKFRHISKRDENAVKPSLIYKQVDIFVKTLYKLFPVEDYILQIINDINDFYKNNVYKKSEIQNLKSHIYNLEIIKVKLIDVFKIVALKYNVISNQMNKKSKNENRNDNETSLLESDMSNNELTLLLFIQSNSILRNAIHYCIHDYIINFMFDFNNENIINKRLNMIIKEDDNEEELIFKYFCDVHFKKQKIIALFNDNYVKYFSSSELHQYYLFIRNINFLFDYLTKLISEKTIDIYFEKGENSLNYLKECIAANNKEFDKIKNEKIKNLSTYDLDKNIIYYSKKCLKYFKYVLNRNDFLYNYDKEKIYDCIKVRLILSITYNLFNKQYESALFLYSSFLLLMDIIKNKNQNKNETKDNADNADNNKNNKEKEIFELFNKTKEKIYPNIKSVSPEDSQNVLKDIKRKLKYHLNNDINFYLLYNQQIEELKLKNQTKGISISLNNNSNKETFDFFSFPSIILKIYQSLGDNSHYDDKLKTKIKLYEIYADSLTYYKREQYNIFFKCLSQKYSKKESLLLYDGKNISSLKIEPIKIENILTKYDFLPSDIAQFFNIIGVALMLLFRRNIANNDTKIDDNQIKLFKKHKELVYTIFNAGLNDNLIIKANDLDLALQKQLNLGKEEQNYRFSLEQIRNCIRINISSLILIKDYNKVYQLITLMDNSLFITNDFPNNYLLEKQTEFLYIINLDKITSKSIVKNSYFNNKKILNILPSINTYLPASKIYRDGKEYLNYYLDLDVIDEFDLFNFLMACGGGEEYNKQLENFITPQNFKEKFSELCLNSSGEEKKMFNLILNKENLGNIHFWKKKFDNKQGKGFLFNPIYINYISKYYNFVVNVFYEDKNKNQLELLNTVSLGIGEGTKYAMNLICDKDLTQTYKVFIPLIDKNEIFQYDLMEIKNYVNNILKRIDEYKDLFPHFSNLLLWQIISIISIKLNKEAPQEINDEIIQIYLDSMYHLGLYEQIIYFINKYINDILKKDKKYYLILFNCYKRLCLYDKSIEAIKQYLYEN